MAAASGWSVPFPAKALPSASPFPPEPESGEKASSEGPNQPSIATVLLVEDNAADIFVIRDILEECKLNENVRIARDGQEALSFLDGISADTKDTCPGLVLLDLNLPGIGGLDVLKRIRRGPHCTRMPVIVITSSESEEDVRAVRELKADAYFRKPTNLTAYLELGRVIQRVLAAHRKNN